MQQAGNPVRKRVRKSRGKGMRTTTGCLTCRKRHKKCDEQQPVCGSCALSNRDCVYATVGLRQNESHRLSITASSPPQAIGPSVSAASTPNDGPSLLGQAAALVETRSLQQQANPQLPSPSILEDLNRNTDTSPSHISHPTPRLDSIGQISYAYSPDTVVSELLTADLASTRWLDQLAADAAEADKDFTLPPTRHPSPAPDSRDAYPASQGNLQDPALPALTAAANSASGPPGIATHTHEEFAAVSERHEWQLDEDICLQDHEANLFRTFAETAALWLDLFDTQRHFSTYATRLALRNLGLMKAILALTSRHAIKSTRAPNLDANLPVQYYYETLHYVQEALQYTSYARSEELLATTMIISTYEMLDEASSNWKRHLKGVFGIQRSQDVNGRSGGLRQAVWWAWLRQDMWGAFREKRACFSFWRPDKDLSELSQDELATRAVYLLSQAVNYCANIHTASAAVAKTIQSGEALLAALERWLGFLGPSYRPLPTPQDPTSVFKGIWIHPPQYAVAMQVYHFAKILITLHSPAVAGFQGYLQTQRVLAEAVDAICGIAMELRDEGSQILSAQCLFGAGLCTQDPVKRETIISLIHNCELRTGWPMTTMVDDLRAEWAKFG